MTVYQAEAVVLRTWPVHEADLIVSLFTRDQGRLRGVAKAAAKSRRRFGGALEPMTHVMATYAERPRQELARLDSFEIIRSPLSEPVDYARAAALAFFAEVLEEMLADHDPQDAVFRLLLAVLAPTRVGSVWMPVTYFALWITRLMGWLPDLTACAVCRERFAGQGAYWHPRIDGVFCAVHKPQGGQPLTPESLAIAGRILRGPVASLGGEPWPRTRARDLRRFLVQTLERHIERRLASAAALATLGG